MVGACAFRKSSAGARSGACKDIVYAVRIDRHSPSGGDRARRGRSLQRSEGGALGAGGGGGFMTGRGQANALSRATAIFGGLFFASALLMSILAGWNRAPRSILDTNAPSNKASTDLTKPAGSGNLLDQLKSMGEKPAESPAPAPAAPAPAAPAPAAEVGRRPRPREGGDRCRGRCRSRSTLRSGGSCCSRFCRSASAP